MAQDLTAMLYMYFVFVGISIWVLYKYSDLIHLDWILMLLWFPIGTTFLSLYESDGWNIFLLLGGFFLVEYLALMHLINNYNRNKKRRN